MRPCWQRSVPECTARLQSISLGWLGGRRSVCQPVVMPDSTPRPAERSGDFQPVSGTSEPQIKGRLAGWRRRVWTCKRPRPLRLEQNFLLCVWFGWREGGKRVKAFMFPQAVPPHISGWIHFYPLCCWGSVVHRSDWAAARLWFQSAAPPELPGPGPRRNQNKVDLQTLVPTEATSGAAELCDNVYFIPTSQI